MGSRNGVRIVSPAYPRILEAWRNQQTSLYGQERKLADHIRYDLAVIRTSYVSKISTGIMVRGGSEAGMSVWDIAKR